MANKFYIQLARVLPDLLVFFFFWEVSLQVAQAWFVTYEVYYRFFF